jgi:hypothetical protein
MQLQNRTHDHFDPTSPSLYRGLTFIADRTSIGYALYTPQQWDQPWSDPHLVVDAHGRILERGAWTGYTAEALAGHGLSPAQCQGQLSALLDAVPRKAPGDPRLALRSTIS